MSVFGEILFLSNVSGTIVFVAVMIFLTIFEALLHSIEVECAKRGYKGLIKKLYREFMIMGFISFAILLGGESSSNSFSATNRWYESILINCSVKYECDDNHFLISGINHFTWPTL
jgi:hypothetical protein